MPGKKEIKAKFVSDPYSIVKKSFSLLVAVPPRIQEYLGLKAKDKVFWYIDEEGKVGLDKIISTELYTKTGLKLRTDVSEPAKK